MSTAIKVVNSMFEKLRHMHYIPYRAKLLSRKTFMVRLENGLLQENFAVSYLSTHIVIQQGPRL